MFFVEHNFKVNYQNAIRFKDRAMLYSILCSEIAKILIDSKQKLVDLVRKYQPVLNDITDHDLAKIVSSKELTGNLGYINELSMLIITEAPIIKPPADIIRSVTASLSGMAKDGSKMYNGIIADIEAVNLQVEGAIERNQDKINTGEVIFWGLIIIGAVWLWTKYQKEKKEGSLSVGMSGAPPPPPAQNELTWPYVTSTPTPVQPPAPMQQPVNTLAAPASAQPAPVPPTVLTTPQT